MKIWILDKREDETLNGVVRFLEEGKKLDLDVTFVAIDDIELVITAELSEKLFINNEKVTLPDVVIPRMDKSYQMKSVIDFLENQWVNIMNSNSARLLANDKFLSLQKFALNSLPVPKTILLKWIPNIDFIETQLSYPIIIKKLDWHAWKWIIKVNDNNELDSVLGMLEDSMSKISHRLILQEYIWERAGQDLRIMVVWWRVVASMLRKWKTWDFKANFSRGWSITSHEVKNTEEIIAIEAANLVGLDIAWVDLLFDKDNGYRICEINASPGFKWLEESTWVNVAWEIMSYIKTRYWL